MEWYTFYTKRLHHFSKFLKDSKNHTLPEFTEKPLALTIEEAQRRYEWSVVEMSETRCFT
jgi:hypothetical protein